MPPSERFTFIDNLRGIACLCIVLHHCRYYPPFGDVFKEYFPSPILTLLNVMNMAVPLFFMISGFAIAHSLRNNNLKRPAVINYIVRRHLRLDPAYWAALIFYFALNSISGVKTYYLTFWDVLANIVYLQNLLQFPESKVILFIAWTLCLEIQFYFAFLLLLWLGSRFRSNQSPFSPVAIALVFATGAACLVLRSFVTITTNLFGYWHFFVAGVLCYLVFTNTISRKFLWCYLGLIAVLVIGFPKGGSGLGADHSRLGLCITACLILLIHFQGERFKTRNKHAKPNRALAFLATISYSLYLVHSPIIRLVYVKGSAATGNAFGPALLYFLLSIAISFGVATIFYYLIEKPTHAWSRRLKPSG